MFRNLRLYILDNAPLIIAGMFAAAFFVLGCMMMVNALLVGSR